MKLQTNLKLAGDQPRAVQELISRFLSGVRINILLGATGTGKTFTIANLIASLDIPTLIIVPNKTLALQIFQDLASYFNKKTVEYYVSYFDFYRPEAYKPHLDLFFEKRTQRNKDLMALRLKALDRLVKKEKVVIVASVAAIYPTASPDDYESNYLFLSISSHISGLESGSIVGLRKLLIRFGFEEVKESFFLKNHEIGKFSFVILEKGFLRIKITLRDNQTDYFLVLIDSSALRVIEISRFDSESEKSSKNLNDLLILPMTDRVGVEKEDLRQTVGLIRKELKIQREKFIRDGRKEISDRINEIVKRDLNDLLETGYCYGIENYSSYLEKRQQGEPPFTILDYFRKVFRKKFLVVLDESHIAIPQIKAMANTDSRRKETLINFGFRLPSCLDNRPLRLKEFLDRCENLLLVSATPSSFDFSLSPSSPVEQIIRPTGLLDPLLEIRSKENCLEDFLTEIHHLSEGNERSLLYVLTIEEAEAATVYFADRGVKTACLHNRINVFNRHSILLGLRRGVFELVVGVNLLREGIDLPEVSLIGIFEADRAGFLRSTSSLIQMIGRAARNSKGRVILYANLMGENLRKALEETERRRAIQAVYNSENNIVPLTIRKPIGYLPGREEEDELTAQVRQKCQEKQQFINPSEFVSWTRQLKRRMKSAAKRHDFDLSIMYRDSLFDLEKCFQEQNEKKS